MPNEIPVTEVKVRIEYPCPECRGSGVGNFSYCRVCGHQPDLSEFTTPGDVMACGHPWGQCIEEPPCGECEGDKLRVEYVTLVELWNLMHKATAGQALELAVRRTEVDVDHIRWQEEVR